MALPKGFTPAGAGKPSVNSAFVVCIRPEAKRACHGQGEVCRKTNEGPNPYVVQFIVMTCGKK